MLTEEELQNIQVSLREIRHHLRLNQRQLAEAIGMNPTYFSRVEIGKSPLQISPALAILALCLAHTLRCPEYYTIYKDFGPIERIVEFVSQSRPFPTFPPRNTSPS